MRSHYIYIISGDAGLSFSWLVTWKHSIEEAKLLVDQLNTSATAISALDRELRARPGYLTRAPTSDDIMLTNMRNEHSILDPKSRPDYDMTYYWVRLSDDISEPIAYIRVGS